MGLFRYIVQGFGWELGSQAARESIAAVKKNQAEQRPPSKRELARQARERDKQATRERKEREATIARNEARIEAELRALKKKSER